MADASRRPPSASSSPSRPSASTKPRCCSSSRRPTTPTRSSSSSSPRHAEFVLPQDRARQVLRRQRSTVEQVTIPDGKTLKLGMEDERVPLLRQRLGVAAPGNSRRRHRRRRSTSPTTRPCVDAIKAFQDELGLTADGVHGPGDRCRAQWWRQRQQGRHHRQHGALALGARRLRRLPRRGEHPRVHRLDHEGRRAGAHHPRRRRHAQEPDPGVLRRDPEHRRQPLLERPALDRRRRDQAASALPTPTTSTARTWRCWRAAR